MDATAGVSCGRITETEHAIEGIRGDMKIMRRRTDEIEEGQVRTNNKMIQEKKQMNLLHLENLRAIEAQNRVLNDLQKNQVESQQILLLTSNGEGSTDSNLQAKLHTILQQNNFLKG
jgi:hypothetical protein